jgi:hypothetical protein
MARVINSSSITVAPAWSIRRSVRRFVSLHFLTLRQSVGLRGRGISPSQGRYLTKHRINTDISDSSVGIATGYGLDDQGEREREFESR